MCPLVTDSTGVWTGLLNYDMSLLSECRYSTLYFMHDIYIYKGGGTHTVVCTAHLYSAKHTAVFIWSSWGVKYQATSSLFSLFFQHKFEFFFSKTYLTMGDAYKRLRGGADFSPFPLRGGGSGGAPPLPPPSPGGGWVETVMTMVRIS